MIKLIDGINTFNELKIDSFYGQISYEHFCKTT